MLLKTQLWQKQNKDDKTQYTTQSLQRHFNSNTAEGQTQKQPQGHHKVMKGNNGQKLSHGI